MNISKRVWQSLLLGNAFRSFLVVFITSSSSSTALAALLAESWLPNPPLLLRKLSRRSRTRLPVRYVWSPTHDRSCSSVSMCFVRSVSNLWYMRDLRDRALCAHTVARTQHCQQVESQGSKEPSTSTTSLTSKTPSKK